jgi:hypothetical protein
MAAPTIDDAVPWYRSSFNIDEIGKPQYTITILAGGVVSLETLDEKLLAQKWELEESEGWFKFSAKLDDQSSPYYLAKVAVTNRLYGTTNSSKAVLFAIFQDPNGGYRILANDGGLLKSVDRLKNELVVLDADSTNFGFTTAA